ncbi:MULTISPECIES: twin-arginine translocase subunit TatC [Metabacillus]|uniref:Twin-arginine translocase subunit TatC n=1 Tax=Metabacillus hrfriensis TaxID=3048891 RepID=A0ACD4R9D1_9BACI|nr:MULTISPECIES: twin-arginine translocase subunit TatC [Metabacillus]UAL51583.1 twin-arginine translocase subunit TatC [Metabacillus dongyingensis]USK27889.1 twin-arginine translocase subunit TatC [Bacillus sp. CMF21]WHZ57097.1 twin-arginine translocase subunit TatC [Metabacillus sp. CT-WN-B3]
MKDQEVALTVHLEELRKRLIYILASFLVFFAVSFAFVEQIYSWLVKDLEFKLALLGPGDVLWIYFKISAVCSIALTIPLAAYHVWRFVLPALQEHERKATFMLIPALFLLFILGISFGYFLVFPIVLSFMQELAGEGFQQFYTSEKYFSFLISLTVPFGILFELPVVILFLTAIGILNPQMLKKSRKIAYFVILITSVLITPPDLISDILVLVPLVLIYEVSINLSSFIYRKKLLKTETLSS